MRAMQQKQFLRAADNSKRQGEKIKKRKFTIKLTGVPEEKEIRGEQYLKRR